MATRYSITPRSYVEDWVPTSLPATIASKLVRDRWPVLNKSDNRSVHVAEGIKTVGVHPAIVRLLGSCAPGVGISGKLSIRQPTAKPRERRRPWPNAQARSRVQVSPSCQRYR